MFKPSWIPGGALTLFASGALLAQAPTKPWLDESEMAILQPYLEITALGDGLTAFPIPGSAMVPLGELTSLLAFGIKVDSQKGIAEGFFIKENRRFSLDLKAGYVEVEGRRLPLLPGQAVLQGRDIFVDSRLLLPWFTIKVEVDFKAATLKIMPKGKLPIQEAWERDRRFGEMASSRGVGMDDLSIGTPISDPYQFADIPFVDASLGLSMNQHAAKTPLLATLSASGDLLWMSSNIRLTRDQEGSYKNSRATLFREDPHAEMLGFLHARRMSIGDLLQVPSLELAGSLPSGRGLLVDNYPMAYRSKFASRTFRGALPDGWTVELFHNGGLVGYRYSQPNGLYEFPDTPLTFGVNQFQLVFHGPQGQTRREVIRLDISSDQPPPGAFYYRVAEVQRDKSQFDGFQITPEMLQNLRRPSSLVEAEYGLTSWLAMKSGVTRVAMADGPHDYGVVGFRSIFSFMSIQGNAAQERVAGRSPGTAIEGVLQTGYGYSNLTLRRQVYRNGFSPTTGLGTQGSFLRLNSETSLNFNGTFTLGNLPMGLGISKKVQVLASGGKLDRDQLNVSTMFPTFTVSSFLGRAVDTQLQGQPASWDGGVMVSSMVSMLGMQGSLAFRRDLGKTVLQSFGLSANYSTESGLNYRFGAQGNGSTLNNVALTANITKMQGAYGYGLDLQFSKAGGYSVGVRLQASFGREPRTGRWVTDAQNMSSMGAVSAQAFLDTNGNKRLDPAERVLNEAGFHAGIMSPSNRSTNPKAAFYTHLGSGQELLLRVDEGTLEDPSQAPSVKAFRMIPRPGRVIKLDYPITVSGEINGTTRLRVRGKMEDFGGLELELVDSTGKPFKTWRTTYDGFFELRGIPLGDYLLRVTTMEAARLGLKSSAPRKIHIDAEHCLFDGQDVVVEYLVPPKEVTTAPEVEAEEPFAALETATPEQVNDLYPIKITPPTVRKP